MRRRALLLALPACTLAQTSKKQSAPIYRCGPGGRQISDKPCSADVPASSVSFDEPSGADREATRQRAAQEAKEAARLQREREQLEARSAPAPQRLSNPSREPQVGSASSGKAGSKPAKKKTKKPAKSRAKEG